VVPGVALWYVIEVLRRNKVLWLKSPFSLCWFPPNWQPMKSVFSTSQWRNRDAEEEGKQPRHQDEGQTHLYAASLMGLNL
jgi:hypothetical protein